LIKTHDKILIVAAHPDDEVLGCGGTIAKLADRGEGPEVSALIVSEGLTSRESERRRFTEEDFLALRQDSLNAARILGIQNSYFENLPNNRLDRLDLLDVIQIIEKYIVRLKPTLVFTHHHGDINAAHRIAYQAVLTACRPLETCSVRKLYSFEIPSSTEWAFPHYKSAFSPNTFVNIADTTETKIAAMQAYRSERRKAPHPRSPEMIRAAALRWGSVSNLPAAEAFELIYDRLDTPL
jgi:LmbE family N-acetylglucosaminyl deacetylase